jgi:glutamate-1-semialdehyde 2,1-aminomutase
MEIERRPSDERIWEEELASWIPQRIFDAHTHIWRPQDCLLTPDDPSSPRPKHTDKYGVVGLAEVRYMDSVLLPGREVEYLLLPSPWLKTDWEAQTAFMADQAQGESLSVAEMSLSPAMDPGWIRSKIDQYGLIGLKPYRTMTSDPVNCRITDMVPEPVLELADEKGLIITMHMAKERALADPENIKDLQRLSPKYPNIRWILAHCARCFAPWAIEKSIDQISDLPNLWIDISAVCASEVFDTLLDRFPAERIMYASDGMAGWLRGKYIWWGYTWEWMREGAIKTAHADWRATYVLYEQLRALGHALRLHRWAPEQIEALFWDNAVRLIHGDGSE